MNAVLFATFNRVHVDCFSRSPRVHRVYRLRNPASTLLRAADDLWNPSERALKYVQPQRSWEREEEKEKEGEGESVSVFTRFLPEFDVAISPSWEKINIFRGLKQT